MSNQLQAYEKSRKFIAGINSWIMDAIMANQENPDDPELTQEDLDALIKRRPEVYGRFAGFRPILPARKSNV
jgi:hypothetical protein